jgi:soluble lytic murein transglycosylase
MRLTASPSSLGNVVQTLPENLRDTPELLFEEARALRLRGDDETAWTTMLRAPSEKGTVVLPERWWSERHIMTRDALKAGRLDVAYNLVSQHTMESGGGFADAEFLSGWIALRFQNKPELAVTHFRELAENVSMPISKARGYYWLGRAEEALGRAPDALAAYRKAAENAETFYGQLAMARLDENAMLRLKSGMSVPAADARTMFESDERVQAIRILSEVGDKDTMRLFATRMALDSMDPARLQLLSELMVSLGDPAMSVRTAKLASYNGVLLTTYLDPVMPVPSLPSGASAPEPALVLGLTRQESEFDAGAVSSAGARGLMQLMPATAKRAAGSLKLPYRPRDLSQPQYNMQLGMATLSDYLGQWGGSYILAIAAYNAGSANVVRWVETYGDPRDPSIDPIDWIEMIPFGETRNYVQRVLENVQVYRNLLGGGEQRLSILSDLYRPNAPKVTVVKYEPPKPAESPRAASTAP